MVFTVVCGLGGRGGVGTVLVVVFHVASIKVGLGWSFTEFEIEAAVFLFYSVTILKNTDPSSLSATHGIP